MQMNVGCFSAYSHTEHTLLKMKAGMVARGIITNYWACMGKYGWMWKDATAGNWKVREAKALQACEIPARYITYALFIQSLTCLGRKWLPKSRKLCCSYTSVDHHIVAFLMCQGQSSETLGNGKICPSLKPSVAFHNMHIGLSYGGSPVVDSLQCDKLIAILHVWKASPPSAT
jgi:hypothetical protein